MATVKRLAPLLLVALALRLALMFDSLWYDETFTLWLSKLDIPHLISATAGDVHPPLWYVISWLSCRVFGFNEWGVRFPALVFGLALIPSVDILLDLLKISGKLKTISMWLVVTSPMLVHYSAEARMYTLMALITCWAAIFAVRGNWIGLTLCITAGMYTQNLFALFIPVLLLLSVQTTLIAGAFAFMFYSPWLPVALNQLNNINAGYWVPEMSAGRATYILYRIITGAGHHEVIVWVSGPMALLMVCAGAWQLRHNKMILAVALLPFVSACVISLITPILIERILIGSVPALLVLCAAGALWVVDRMRNKWEAYPLVLAWSVALITVIMTTTNSDLRIRYGTLPIKPGDVCYHLSSSTMIPVEYAQPNCDNYLWKNRQTLDYGISNETKEAMGMHQTAIENVPQNKTIWLFHYTGPYLTGEEFVEQDRILTKYPPADMQVIQDDALIAQTTVWRLSHYERAGRN